ncbi:MAG: hypothetical protein ACW981_16645 [Candidatus Hodarchaeales archaeon]|jgi:hypothetical protein
MKGPRDQKRIDKEVKRLGENTTISDLNLPEISRKYDSRDLYEMLTGKSYRRFC